MVKPILVKNGTPMKRVLAPKKRKWWQTLPSNLLQARNSCFLICVSILLASSLPFMPSITIVIYSCLNACILGKSHGRIARFQFIFISKPTWFKLFN
jgi:hypothetical protein